jgi:polyhydroxyalkanoate synthesis regulator protein
MQTMMSTYMDQSKKMVHQMQDQLQNQTRTMFTGIQIPGFPPDAVAKPKNTEK